MAIVETPTPVPTERTATAGFILATIGEALGLTGR